MLRLTEIRLGLDHRESELKAAILCALGISEPELLGYHVHRRGYDARKSGQVVFVYTLDAEIKDEPGLLARFRHSQHIRQAPDETYHYPVQAPANFGKRPVVIGTGPCGLFAGLSLARMGFKPLILERGKEVRERSQDVWGFWRQGRLNPESNVQFGEGGAGTFSDGKLHTGIKDRGHHIKKILQDFVNAGAPGEILYISKPHIGTLRLVKVVENLRRRIVELGGEIRFGSHVTDIAIDNGEVRGVTLASGESIAADQVILALGHSARDTFEMLHRRGVHIEPKPFSIGFRIEHPQTLINRCRLGSEAAHPVLGAADYKLVHHCKNGRSVYSFCMCPGGQVVAATSEEGRVVTNGMSHYSRSERNANAGIVVDITPQDFGSDDPLAGIALQRRLEEKAFELGGKNYNAPAQRVGDFLASRPSTGPGLVIPSYTPGVTWTDLGTALPDYAIAAIREAIPVFDKSLKGFAMDDAVLTAVETRTSAPIRITRDENFESTNTKGLFPAGEGAGFAGGIISAAVDGMKVAEAVARKITQI
ncbi:MAG: NAD(P)/FAD-dependent oxidoreductase [Sulfuricaulis sp.]|uniref:NAD(P)/FAD-dependent oxidoreductase n=1 Tax=Sulfuricaulis sp. TaxID=2003553 RepID=UPI003C3B1489